MKLESELTMQEGLLVTVAEAVHRHHVETMKLHKKLGIDDSHLPLREWCRGK